MTMTHAVCLECKQEFDYDMRPGYPRKYCPTCSEIKKKQYEARSGEAQTNTPIAQPAEWANKVEQQAPTEEKKQDVVRAAALTKMWIEANEWEKGLSILKILETYQYFLNNL